MKRKPQELSARKQASIANKAKHVPPAKAAAALMPRVERAPKSRGALQGQPGGRYPLERLMAVLDTVADGHTMEQACARHDIPKDAVYRRMREDSDEGRVIKEAFVVARRTQAHVHVDRIQQIAEDVLAEKVRPEAARVSADIYRWLAGKANPGEYSDKHLMEHSGPGGSAVKMEHTFRLVEPAKAIEG
jgi:hypothetical protein